MRSYTVSFCVGIFYSFFVVFVGGWYFHFLPTIAITHALLLGVFAVSIDFVGSRFLHSRAIINGSIIFVLSVYCYFWLVNVSSLIALNSLETQVYSFSLLVLMASLAYFIRYFASIVRSNFSRGIASVLLTVFLVLLLSAKGMVASFVPFSWIDRLALKINPIASKQFTQRSLPSVFYPFSLPIEKGLARYSWLIDQPDFQSSNHVFMVVLDALRRRSVGSHVKGSPVTPTIDRFKKNALSFEKYYVQAPWTKPSTASLFTGLYLREHGTFLGKNPDDSIEDNELFYGQPLPARFRTLAERLVSNDVKTFGAVTIGHISSKYRFDQGFGTWFNPGENSVERIDYAAVQRLLFWLQRERPKKSFSYVHMAGPHYPYAQSLYNLDYWKQTKFLSDKGFEIPGEKFPHPKEMSRFTLPPTKDQVSPEQVEFLRHLYRSKLNLYDREIVRPLMNGLKKIGAMNSSYVIVGADHGEELFDHAKYGHQRNLREPVISPPLIIRYPGESPSGTSDRMVESIDLTATILDWMNSDTDGLSGSSFAEDPQQSDDSQKAFVEMGQKIHLTRRENREKINLKGTDLGVSVALVRKGPWKFYHEYSDNKDVLINLDKDPGESTAVTDHPEVTDHLRGRIFEELGSDSALVVPPGPLIKGGETYSENLRGLGYL